MMPVTETQRLATQQAIMRIAYATANQAKGQRQQDAIAHCRRLGIDPTAPSFKEACK